MSTQTKILLTGASGYVGGRLLRRLERRGGPLRCLARRPEELAGRAAPATEVCRGDLLEPASLPEALAGVDTAFYLVHSMGAGPDFEERDRRAARNFAAAARESGVRRIVYLGGLGSGEDLSPHLRSRQEVGRVLSASGVPVVELRASIVIGSGSLSFEMVRSLAERLPVMITPRWVDVMAQPIAIDDLLDYLVAAADVPLAESRVFEIGGADRVSYGDLMREYARQRGLRRAMIRVPVLTPRLSSLWLGLVTPLYARVGRKLVESIRHPTVVEDDTALEVFDVRPRGMPEAMAAALRNEEREIAESRWCDALSSGGEAPSWRGGALPQPGRRRALRDPRRRPHERLRADPAHRRRAGLVRLRRALAAARLPGSARRRRRRAPWSRSPGPAAGRRGARLLAGRGLRAGPPAAPAGGDEAAGSGVARVRGPPGAGWLHGSPDGDVRPVGLLGLAYWYAVLPFHHLVFAGMLREIARRARLEEQLAGGAEVEA